MKRVLIVGLVLIIIIVGVVFAISGKQPSIVGTWTMQTSPIDWDYDYAYKLYFYEDGTGVVEAGDTFEMKWSIYDKTNLTIYVQDRGVLEYYIAVFDKNTLNLVNKEQPTAMTPSNGVYYSKN